MDGFTLKRLAGITFFLCSLLPFLSYSQKKQKDQASPYQAIDKIIDLKNDSLNSLNSISSFINSSFSKEEDKCRAVFYWICKNISYDPALMFTYKTDNTRNKIATQTLEYRTGVCIGYACLFDTLARLCNLNSYIVEGSTQQTFLPSVIGHAWNAVKINNEWKLLDATWGSGGLQGKTFVKKLNNSYFFSDPSKLIRTHLPIDPIWQCLDHPLNLYEFYSGKPGYMGLSWNYQDSINTFLTLQRYEKWNATIRRLDKFGANSEITSTHYNHLKNDINGYYIERLNESTILYNKAVSGYNEYIQFKNKRFTPKKTDDEISKMLSSLTIKLDKSKTYLNVPSEIAETNATMLQNTKKMISDLEKNIENETKFVNTYLATKPSRRKGLFYVKTYTVFGLPVK